MKAGAVPLTDAEMEERRLFAKELEIYGAEEQPWVSTHKQMWRAGARAIRDLLATIDADRVELVRLRRIESRAKEWAVIYAGTHSRTETVTQLILGEEGSQTK